MKAANTNEDVSSASNTLTKDDLVEVLFEKIGMNKREARNFVDAFFDSITETLIHGRDVRISGFGGFHLRDKASRPGRNPRTMEEVEISARRVVTFHGSRKLQGSKDE